nr:HNH endonuclease signature motif containing protein [uncultured Vibrio sp.]
MQGKNSYSTEMIAFLKDHYPKAPVKDWVDKFNERFGTDKSKCALIGSCKRFGIKSGRTGLFEKGLIPHNKGKPFPSRGRSKETQFGGVRSNRNDDEKPLGSTRIDSKDGYLLIKVRMGTNAYELAHRILWEQHHGKIPPNHVIRFYDNSPEKLANPTIENLFMVSRQVHARLTQMKLSDIPMEHKETMILIAKIEQQIQDKS